MPETVTCGPQYDGGSSVSMGVVKLDTTTSVADGSIGVQFAHRSTAVESTPIDVCIDPPTCSSFLLVHTPATDGVLPSFFQVETIPIDAGADAATSYTGYVPVLVNGAAGPVKYSGTALSTPATSLPIHVTDPNTMFGVFVQPLDGGQPNDNPWPGTVSSPTGAAVPGDIIAMPLGAIALLSSWNASTASAPSGFQLGQSYTFLLAGDPVAQQVSVPNPDGGSIPVQNPLYDGRGVHILAFPNAFVPKTF